jgi:hypothetical protein
MHIQKKAHKIPLSQQFASVVSSELHEQWCISVQTRTIMRAHFWYSTCMFLLLSFATLGQRRWKTSGGLEARDGHLKIIFSCSDFQFKKCLKKKKNKIKTIKNFPSLASEFVLVSTSPSFFRLSPYTSYYIFLTEQWNAIVRVKKVCGFNMRLQFISHTLKRAHTSDVRTTSWLCKHVIN